LAQVVFGASERALTAAQHLVTSIVGIDRASFSPQLASTMPAALIGDGDLKEGLDVEILEGDHKGQRGPLVGWTSSKGVKHKETGGHASTVCVAVDGKHTNFGYAKVSIAAGVDFDACLCQRDGISFGEHAVATPSGRAGPKLQQVFTAGECNTLVDHLITLRDDKSCWVRIKQRGELEGSHVQNKDCDFFSASHNPEFLLSSCATKKNVADMMELCNHPFAAAGSLRWDSNVGEVNVLRELTPTLAEKAGGIKTMRVSWIKINSGILRGPCDMLMLELVYDKSRDHAGMAYFHIASIGNGNARFPQHGPAPLPEGTRVDAGFGLFSSQTASEGQATLSYCGSTLQLTGWEAKPHPKDAAALNVLPPAKMALHFEGGGGEGLCGLGFFGC